MKKFEGLGKSLSKGEQKKVIGGVKRYICTCSNGSGGVDCTGTSSFCRDLVIEFCGNGGASCHFG